MMRDQWRTGRWSWWRWGAVLVTLLGIISGCRLLPRSEQADRIAPNYAEILPAGWSTLGNVRAVNLNAADVDANLLLFRFDMGQVGAMIFENTANVSLAQAYWLLPRHFGNGRGLGHGFIAPPNSTVEDIRIDVLEVNRDSGPGREMVIRGGNSHLTFVWWDAQAATYDVTQLVAPGGFGGVDWEAWENGPQAITSLSARLPLIDYRARSQICREMVYVRRPDLPGIVFDERPQGLRFCMEEFSPHPFYAEGVVLAYLLWPRPDTEGLTALLTPGVTLPQLDAEVVYDRLVVERIEDITAHLTLPVAQAEMPLGGDGVTTPVCVELAERANPNLRRWVVFTLRYLPIDAVARLPGRWTLTSARTEPPPTQPVPDYCTTILARSAP